MARSYIMIFVLKSPDMTLWLNQEDTHVIGVIRSLELICFEYNCSI